MPNQGSHVSLNAEARVSAFIEVSPQLRHFLRRYLVNEADAQDLMQQIATCFLSVPDTTAIGNPHAYLFGIARNLVAHYCTTRAGDCLTFDSGAANKVLETTVAPSDTAAEMDAIQHDILRRFNALPVLWRKALALQAEDGLSYEEIAKRLRLAPETVRKYLAQGKAALRGDGP